MTPTLHLPDSAPTQEAGVLPDGGSDQPPKTVRVPIICHAPTAHASLDTPTPPGDRRLSRTSISRANRSPAGDDESGVGLRVGDTFLGFKLVEELGQGAFARVFLAHQESLAGRPVALKITLRPTREAERLARLQHTNVVPVYSVHNAAPVQVICMPYLGRRTIADVIRAYRHDQTSRELPGRKTSGTRAARTTDIADSGSSPRPNPAPAAPRPQTIAPGEQSFIGDPLGVLRVLSQLAAGLAHAHDRGILHLDLKPANVLLPDIGEPMLLDFNLSFDVNAADRELVGGTVPYMATEQLLDLRTRGGGNIDARTDLYSLGVMAFEMLTGTVPFPASSKDLIDMDGLIAVRRQSPPSIRELNPAVTPAIEAIVHKLLAPEPADRYQSAADLKIDLDRHLANLPLAIAREPSPRERLGKWRRRNPGVPVRLLAASLFGLALGLGGAYLQWEAVAAKADAVGRVKATRAALDTTRLDLILPGDAKARARGIAKARELLAAYGLPDNPQWMTRPDVQRLSEPERAALTGDLGELALLLAVALWQEAESRGHPDRAEAARDILKLNRAARTCFPAEAVPPLLDRQARELAEAAGEAAPLAGVDRKPTTVRDRFLDAAAAISSAKFADALKLLKQVVADQPTHAAAQFCVAYCMEQLGQHAAAKERYDVAQSLMPKDPRPAFQRGVMYTFQINYDGAEAEYTQAIGVDPDHLNSYRNRGMTRYRLGLGHQERRNGDEARRKFQEAEADLTRALELGAPAIPIYTYRYQVRRQLGDTAGAAADQARAESLEPTQEADFIARGMARLKTKDLKGALADFQAAEFVNRRSLAALTNQIHVLADKLNEPEDALAVVTRMTEHYPDYATGTIARAVILARLGRRAEAHAATDQALRLAPKDPEVIYRAACVYSITSTTQPADQTKALALLKRAITNGFKRVALIQSDPDLNPLRGIEQFRELADAAKTLIQ